MMRTILAFMLLCGMAVGGEHALFEQQTPLVQKLWFFFPSARVTEEVRGKIVRRDSGAAYEISVDDIKGQYENDDGTERIWLENNVTGKRFLLYGSDEKVFAEFFALDLRQLAWPALTATGLLDADIIQKLANVFEDAETARRWVMVATGSRSLGSQTSFSNEEITVVHEYPKDEIIEVLSFENPDSRRSVTFAYALDFDEISYLRELASQDSFLDTPWPAPSLASSGQRLDPYAGVPKIITSLFPTPEDQYIAARNITKLRGQKRAYVTFDAKTVSVTYENKNGEEKVSVRDLKTDKGMGGISSFPDYNPIDKLIEMGFSHESAMSDFDDKADSVIISAATDPKILHDIWRLAEPKAAIPMGGGKFNFSLIPDLLDSDNISGYNFLVSYVDFAPQSQYTTKNHEF